MWHREKNSKIAYFVRSYAKFHLPHAIGKWLMERDLKNWEKRPDSDAIRQRVDYYCQLNNDCTFDRGAFLADSHEIGEMRVGHPSVYYLDTLTYARCFPHHLRLCLLPGDITHVPEVPSIVKSRPVNTANANSVLLNLDKVRHFVFLKDHIPFRQKHDVAIFRGLIGQCFNGGPVKQGRYDFMQKFFGHRLVDAGVVDNDYPQWRKPKITFRQHLDRKFIMALEGNDVASNLKWVMSSNSVAVMPRPTCETWFMEGTLIPNYHYIECKPDYSDLEERLLYYIAHPAEAEAIVEHAHEYVAQFQNKKRERIISYLVLQRYLNFCNTDLLSP